jgi:NB-ARC domain/Rx N-terminal domain
MAEAVVSVLVYKLSDLLIGEAVFLNGLKDQIELVMLQLHQMQCFLKDADTKQNKDERVKGWVKHIRDIAYETEDAIDTFLGEIAPSQRKGAGIMKVFVRQPAELFARHKLGENICKIQAKLKIIFEGRLTFGIENLGGERRKLRSVVRGVLNPDKDDYEIVGFKDEKRNLIDQLIASGSVQRRQVVSIVGQGGLGKTTLAQKIFNDNEIKTHFDVAIWLTISSEFKLVDILRKGLRKLGTAISKEKENDEEFLLEETKRVLGDKRYLVVLDDVWEKDFFALFRRALPDVGNGSRVLMTSRFLSAAVRADPGSTPHELRYLDERESLQLLLAKAFPHNAVSICFTHNDVVGVAKQLARKCGGLPLALVVVGGLLSTKAPTYNDWNRVLQTIDWQSDGGECMQVLATSYQDLPYTLKQCFLYMACFPEDYDIHTATLIKMWIAEGFIKTEGRWTLEDASERYLEELTQR